MHTRRSAAAMVAMGWAATGSARATPRVGAPAPDFSVTTFGGHKISLADLRGDVIVLNFWATWCAPCRHDLPLLETCFEAYNPYGFQVLAVATENSLPESKLRPLAQALKIPFVHHLSGPYRDLGALPTNFVIDRAGTLVYAKADAFDLDSFNALIIPLIKQPIPERPPAPGAKPLAGAT